MNMHVDIYFFFSVTKFHITIYYYCYYYYYCTHYFFKVRSMLSHKFIFSRDMQFQSITCYNNTYY